MHSCGSTHERQPACAKQPAETASHRRLCSHCGKRHRKGVTAQLAKAVRVTPTEPSAKSATPQKAAGDAVVARRALLRAGPLYETCTPHQDSLPLRPRRAAHAVALSVSATSAAKSFCSASSPSPTCTLTKPVRRSCTPSCCPACASTSLTCTERQVGCADLDQPFPKVASATSSPPLRAKPRHAAATLPALTLRSGSTTKGCSSRHTSP